MLEAVGAFPRQLKVHVLLDDAPHYRGSIHDDAVARARGYKAALIPGAFVYGHMTRLAVEAWGIEWIEHGAMSARFRRPVYNHDDITVNGAQLEDDGSLQRSQISVSNDDGEEVATGWVAMPRRIQQAVLPRPLELVSTPEVPPHVAAGELPVGAPLRGRDRLITDQDVEASRRAFAEIHPIYPEMGIVHPGMLMRLGMGDVNSGWKFPAAVVLVEVEAHHYRLVRPGQYVRTAGWIAETYERKGKHYFVTDEYLLADGEVAARFRRTQIYG